MPREGRGARGVMTSVACSGLAPNRGGARAAILTLRWRPLSVRWTVRGLGATGLKVEPA
jgi:hypothetical protein